MVETVVQKGEVTSTAELLQRRFGKNLWPELRWAAQAVDAGKHALISGIPGSGKTSFLAALAAMNPNAWVLSASPGAVKELRWMTSSLARNLGISGDTQDRFLTFPAGIFRQFNQWRLRKQQTPVRLATDAQMLPIVKELSAQLESGEFPWPSEFDSAQETESFAANLWDGIYQIRSRGLGATQLRQLGEQANPNIGRYYPQLALIMELLEEKRAESHLESRQSYWSLDTASLLDEYLRVVQGREDIDNPRLVLVDESQNASAQMLEILLEWVRRGTQLVMVGCAPAAVNTYRGGQADLISLAQQKLAELLPRREQNLHLSTWTRCERPPELSCFNRRLIESFLSSDMPAKIPQISTQPSPEAKPALVTICARSRAKQYHLIGQYLQGRRIFGELSREGQFDLQGKTLRYSDMAVLTNSQAEVAAVKQVLTQMGIPTQSGGSASVLHEGRITSWLLRMMQLACQEKDRGSLTASDFSGFDLIGLFCSPLVGYSNFDLLRICEIWRQFYQEAAASKQLRTQDNFLSPYYWCVKGFTDLVTGQVEAANLPQLEELNGVINCARAWHTARQQFLDAPGEIRQVLWALWDGIGRGEALRELALQPGRMHNAAQGATREQINLDLDQVMDLEKAADWYQARNPGGNAAEFVQSVLAESLPTGTVGAHHLRGEAVTVTTTFEAAGRHWPVVVVASLIEGEWPNQQWPGTWMGTSAFDLEEALLGATAGGTQEIAARAWEFNFKNQARMFCNAVSRARHTLVLATVSGETEYPSKFYLLATQKALGAAPDSGGGITHFSPSQEVMTNLRDAVIQLRQEVIPPGDDQGRLHPQADQQQAAELLAYLSNQGVPGANPLTWWGVHDTKAAAPAETLEVRIQPSSWHRALENPLDGLFGQLGYLDETRTETFSNLALGTIVHQCAQEIGQKYWDIEKWKASESSAPEPVEKAQILRELQSVAAKQVEFLLQSGADAVAGSVSHHHFQQRLERCLENLAQFMHSFPYPSLFEYPVSGCILGKNRRGQQGQLVYQARIDRVMFTQCNQGQYGEPVLVDYKTGAAGSYNADAVALNLQLLAYQHAFNHSHSSTWTAAQGAEIVVLGDEDLHVFKQGALTDSEREYPTKKVQLTASQRLILADPAAWLSGKNPGELGIVSDLEKMTLEAFLQDRVNLSLDALSGPQLAQIRASYTPGVSKYLPLEGIERYEAENV